MTFYQRKLSEEELKQIEEEGVYSQFTEAQICGYGVYGAEVVKKDDGYYLLYTLGSSCD